MVENTKLVESKIIYDKMANNYEKVSSKKLLYIDSINNLILENAPNIINNYLDVGCGDGVRTKTLSYNLGAKHTVLVDNSKEMIRLAKKQKFDEVYHRNIIDFNYNKKFELVTTLWNVFGHIKTKEDRIKSLRKIYSLLSDDGLFMVDVNNRYNIEYGFLNVMKNIIIDLFPFKSKFHGWYFFNHEDDKFLVYLHNPIEFIRILHKVGFKICSVYGVDYKSGVVNSNFLFSGQTFIIAKKRVIK